MTAQSGPAPLAARFADNMGHVLGPNFPEQIGLAVSGGGDSMAMLGLAHHWARVWGVKLWVFTVDHGLRAESADEAAMVAKECAALGHPHASLRWQWDGKGNMQDAGRRARLALLDHARGGLNHILMAHTQDDVAETFLLRLKRGSGVEGLSAMQAKRRVVLRAKDRQTPVEILGDLPQQVGRSRNFVIVRPCLDMKRDELRHYARTLHIPWADDPSNDDPKYDRVRMRQALPDLAALGLSVPVLADTAARMDRAKTALQKRAADVWEKIGHEARHTATGDIVFDRAGFELIERDTQLRLLAAATQYVATAQYRPRAAVLEDVLDRVLGGGGGTVHGCDIRAEREVVRVFREYAAVSETSVTVGEDALWDSRWRVFHQEMKGFTIRALGEDGWAQVPAKSLASVPFHAAKSLPSLWDGPNLMACDAVAVGPGHTARLRPMGKEMNSFKGILLSH